MEPVQIRILALAPDGEPRAREIAVTELKRALDSKMVVWIDIVHPDPTVVSLLADVLELDPLTVEDCLLPLRMPKLDRLARGAAFVAAFAVRLERGSSPRLRTSAVALALGPAFLVTLRREELPELAHRFESLLIAQAELAKVSGAGLAHAALDALVDVHLPIMLKAAEAAEDLEADLDPSGQRRGLTALERLVVLRRDLLAFRRLAVAQQEVVRRVGRLFPDVRAHLADVTDNQREAIDTAAAISDYIDGAIEAYRVRRDAEAEEGIRWLTVIAGILGPLSLLLGFWQVNFPNIPGSGWVFGWPVFVGLQLSLISAGVWYFRRRGML
jgi:magnesium transporter